MLEPMHAGHILLGRPWQFDRIVIHDGFKNRYSFVKDNKPVTLVQLTLRQVYEDQLKIKRENEKNCENERSKEIDEKESKKRVSEKKRENKKSGTKESFYAKKSDVKKASLHH